MMASFEEAERARRPDLGSIRAGAYERKPPSAPAESPPARASTDEEKAAPERAAGDGKGQRTQVRSAKGDALVGLLRDAADPDLCVLCHGFRSSKESKTIRALSEALVAKGVSTFSFDFSGNGESGGSFAYGNYWAEVEDLRAVVLYWRSQGRAVRGIVGHSKGGNIVLLYAAKYADVPKVVNVSGRFHMERGTRERFGATGLQKIQEEGGLELSDSLGAYVVTRESLEERLATDMSATKDIPHNVRVLTVHGSDDQTVPVIDANCFDRVIPSHQLEVIHEADHNFRAHRESLASIVSKFLALK